jgi:hypothetical protein
MNLTWKNSIRLRIVEMIKKHTSWISLAIACSIAALVSVSALAGDGQPIVRAGKHCPSGYRKSGEYCVPRAGSTQSAPAIEKKGSCPSGYRKNGEYCVPRAGSNNTPKIIEKKGSCPSGYRKSGQYCIERGK